MKQIARLLKLKSHERFMALEAAALLVVISPILKFGPGRLTGQVIQRASSLTPDDGNLVVARQVAAAVNQVSPHWVKGTCLARALTGWVMVRRRGQAATVRIGVQRSPESEIAAHAWLECSGQRVIGGETAQGYTPFPAVS